jgi:hypothetical protein
LQTWRKPLKYVFKNIIDMLRGEKWNYIKFSGKRRHDRKNGEKKRAQGWR